MPGSGKNFNIARFHKIGEIFYTDEKGRVLEKILMREFYEWSSDHNQYILVRTYPLDREREVNPKGDGL